MRPKRLISSRRAFLAGAIACYASKKVMAQTDIRPNRYFRGAKVPENFASRLSTQERLSIATEKTLQSSSQLQSLLSAFAVTSQHSPATLPSRFDWRDKGRVTPVRNQSSCGSCWIFAALGAFESAYLIANPNVKFDTFEVSEQEILDCSFSETNCFVGGFHDVPFTYLLNFGAVDNDIYRYNIDTPTRSSYCNSNFGSRPYYAKNWNYVSSSQVIPDVTSIKRFIIDKGPVVSGVTASDSWDGYSGGVIDGPSSDGKGEAVNHEVLIVGWDDAAKGKSFPAGAWIVKNSRGTSWGGSEKGYLKIPYSCCNIGFGASWITAWPALTGAEAVSMLTHMRELDILNALVPPN